MSITVKGLKSALSLSLSLFLYFFFKEHVTITKITNIHKATHATIKKKNPKKEEVKFDITTGTEINKLNKQTNKYYNYWVINLVL